MVSQQVQKVQEPQMVFPHPKVLPQIGASSLTAYDNVRSAFSPSDSRHHTAQPALDFVATPLKNAALFQHPQDTHNGNNHLCYVDQRVAHNNHKNAWI